jgi:hypothetical protein
MAQPLLAISRLVAPREPLEGSDIVEAREAFEFWSARAARLPWHRRAARREAREMASRWRARLVGAHLERWRLGGLGAALVPLIDTRGRRGSRHVRRLAWTASRRSVIARTVVLGFTAMAFAGAAIFVLAVVATAHVLGL